MLLLKQLVGPTAPPRTEPRPQSQSVVAPLRARCWGSSGSRAHHGATQHNTRTIADTDTRYRHRIQTPDTD
ncbi:uncharacterized, partial [Tachysurus ichikawai]